MTAQPYSVPKITVVVKRPPAIKVTTSGPIGPKGPQGEVAVDSTVTGPEGTQAVVEDLDARTTHALLKFTIPKGDTGLRGTWWWWGAGPPPDVPEAIDGDMYLDTTNGDVYYMGGQQPGGDVYGNENYGTNTYGG